MFSSNQVRHLIVGNSVSDAANVVAFEAAAVANSILACAGDGNVYASRQKQIAFKQYNSRGLVSTSDLIDVDKITYIKALGYLPAALSTTTIDLGTTDTTNSYYEIGIEFSNWGSLSAEDTYVKKATYTSGAATDTNTIADGLAKSLVLALASEEPNSGKREEVVLNGANENLPSNPYFTVSVSGEVITLTEKEQDYVVGKKDGRPLVYKVTSMFDNEDEPTITTTGANRGMGVGKEVKNLEWFAKGYTGDIYRGMGYPHNFETEYVASTASGYNILEIGYYFSGEGHAVQKSDKTLTIAVLSTDGDFGEDLIGRVAAMTGLPVTATSLATGAVVDEFIAAGDTEEVTFFPATATYTVLSEPTGFTTEFGAGITDDNVLTITAANNAGDARGGFIVIAVDGVEAYTLKVSQLGA